MKKWKKLLAAILAIFIISTMLPAILTSAGEVTEFPLKTGNNYLVADANTRSIVLFSQDPVTKMITAKLQIHNDSTASETLRINGFGIALSYNEKVAPYSYKSSGTPALFPPGEVNLYTPGIDIDEVFSEYCMYNVNPDTNIMTTQFISRDADTGGVIGTKGGTTSTTNYYSIAPGATFDIIDFYFMPVNGEKLDLDMFGLTYYFDNYSWSRLTNFFGNGVVFVESTSAMVNTTNTYIINPSSFKLHVQHPKPDVSANNATRVVTGYNANTMEWSYDNVTYNSGEPVVKSEAHSIFVRVKGDANYSGNDTMYGDYKKYLTSEPTEVVFDAQSGAAYYRVTFNSNGGTPTTPQTRDVEEGTAIGAGNMPTATNPPLTFIEWNTAQDGSGTEFTASTIVSASITVYAQWNDPSRIPVEVTFDPGSEGTMVGPSSKTVYYNEAYGELPVYGGTWTATRPADFGSEYRLEGWAFTAPLYDHDFIETTTLVTNASAHTLYAKFILHNLFTVLTVAFDGNSGTPKDQFCNLQQGTTVAATGQTPPVVPTRTDGYTFTGWNTLRDGQGSPFSVDTTEVLSNMRVYAQYTPPLTFFYVTFNGNNGLPAETIVPVEEGKSVEDYEIPVVTRDDYKFIGWNTDPNGLGSDFDDTTVVTSNIEVYAIWEFTGKYYYSVTFHGNGGTVNGQISDIVGNIEEGTAIGANMPADPTWDADHRFDGWNTLQSGFGDDFDATTPVTEDIEVYAQWTYIGAIYCTVTFDGNNGTPAIQTKQVVQGGTVGLVNMPTVTRDGYYFDGWEDGQGQPFTGDTIVQGDMEVSAKWVPACIVTFDSNGGSPAIAPTKTVKSGTAVGSGNMPAEPTKNGFFFDGWNTKDDGSGTNFTGATIVAEDITVYAKWVPACIVTFDSNGGSPATAPTRTVKAGTTMSSSSVNMPANPTQSGYTFVGWNTEEDGTGSVFNRDTIVSEDITVYAKWTKNDDPRPPTPTTYYTVTFDSNGGLPTTAPTRSVRSGSSVGAGNMPANPTFTGFVFAGWNTKQDGTGTEFTAATSVSSSIRVYAKWTDDTTVITPPVVPGGFIEDHIAYIYGYPDNSVRPDNNITRAEVAAIFYRLLADAGKSAPRQKAFTDVADGLWYSQPINYLAELGIIIGYGDGTFRPNQPITRAEFATIASRFDNLEDSSTNAFPDIETHWAKAFINSAAIKGWVEGYPDGTFKPEKNISRAEVVKIVNTILNRMIKLEDIPEGIRQFTDFIGHWAYTHIVEASNDHDYVRNDDNSETWTLR